MSKIRFFYVRTLIYDRRSWSLIFVRTFMDVWTLMDAHGRSDAHDAGRTLAGRWSDAGRTYLDDFRRSENFVMRRSREGHGQETKKFTELTAKSNNPD